MFALSGDTCYNVINDKILSPGNPGEGDNDKRGVVMKPLSKSQKKIYDYLVECSQNGRVPSVRELCDVTGLKSTSTVHFHLNNLEKMGLIEREHGVNRCIKVVGRGERSANVPVLGNVAAGMPILAVEEIEGYVPVPEKIRRGRELFALKIKGDSMIDVGIFDGDVIIVNSTPSANNGDIVVALVDDSATVKRFFKENGHFRLQPENENYEPIIVDEVNILGTVIALFRNYD